MLKFAADRQAARDAAHLQIAREQQFGDVMRGGFAFHREIRGDDYLTHDGIVCALDQTVEMNVFGADAIERLWAAISFHLGRRAPLLEALFPHTKFPLLRKPKTQVVREYHQLFLKKLNSGYAQRILADAMRQRLLNGRSDTGQLLLYIGRLSAEKQIERIRPVLDANPEARLALVGDGPYRQQLETLFAGSATHFVGYLAGDELASAYASADAFLFPSSTETLGLVLLEAMAAGCPVVGANRGGIPDIVTDGLNGCLYEPEGADGGASSLTAAVQRLLGESGEHQELRHNARQEAERWGWAGATEQLRGYYRQVLSQGKTPALAA